MSYWRTIFLHHVGCDFSKHCLHIRLVKSIGWVMRSHCHKLTSVALSNIAIFRNEFKAKIFVSYILYLADIRLLLIPGENKTSWTVIVSPVFNIMNAFQCQWQHDLDPPTDLVLWPEAGKSAEKTDLLLAMWLEVPESRYPDTWCSGSKEFTSSYKEASIYNIVCIDMIVWRVLVWKVIVVLRFQLKSVNMPSKAFLSWSRCSQSLALSMWALMSHSLLEMTLLPAIVTTTIQSWLMRAPRSESRVVGISSARTAQGLIRERCLWKWCEMWGLLKTVMLTIIMVLAESPWSGKCHALPVLGWWGWNCCEFQSWEMCVVGFQNPPFCIVKASLDCSIFPMPIGISAAISLASIVS